MKENNFAQTSSIFDVVENEVKEVAAATMKVAIASKELNDEEFVEAIEHASRGLVFFRRSTNNPERVDFCSWEPYTATHKKKDPGKKRFNAIESTIIDTYQRGRSMKAQGAETVVAADRTAKESVKDIISNIVNIVQIYLHEDEIVKGYLRSHSSGIESELSSLTRGVIVGSITGGKVELSSATGKSVTITTEGLSLSDVSGELSSAVTLLLTHAALCSQTRNVVDCLVDVDELSELYFSNTSVTQTETPPLPYVSKILLPAHIPGNIVPLRRLLLCQHLVMYTRTIYTISFLAYLYIEENFLFSHPLHLLFQADSKKIKLKDSDVV